MKREKMLDNLMAQLVKMSIKDRATCLTVLGRIKTENQYHQMMKYLQQEKNLTKMQIVNKAIEITKNM